MPDASLLGRAVERGGPFVCSREHSLDFLDGRLSRGPGPGGALAPPHNTLADLLDACLLPGCVLSVCVFTMWMLVHYLDACLLLGCLSTVWMRGYYLDAYVLSHACPLIVPWYACLPSDACLPLC